MITEFYQDFVNKVPLTENRIINLTLTELGAGLYPYLLMLRNADRKEEHDLIKVLRDIIFDIRDKKGVRTNLEVSDALNKVYDLLKVQIVMLRANPERKWECELFHSYRNDLADFKYRMNPNKDS